MANSNYVGFPNMQMAVTVTLSNANAVVTRGTIKRGSVYRVVSDLDCWINFEQPAVAGSGMFLPAKTVNFFQFGSRDPQGTDVELNVISTGAGNLNLVPILPMF